MISPLQPLLRSAFGFLFSLLTLRAEIMLQEKVDALPFAHAGPFVRTGDGTIWGLDARGALVSANEGKSWSERRIFDPEEFVSSGERALLRTREGVLLYAFLNVKERRFTWDDKQGGPQPDCRLPVYLARSADDGATWAKPVLLQEGWCGAVRHMIQMSSGRIVLIAQQARAYPGRHVTITYYSDDLGNTWRIGGTIDLGEPVNYPRPVAGLNAATHGGAIEGTLLERSTGGLRLWLRVPHGCFFEAESGDAITWSLPVPSPVEASDSPGMVTRLASGRAVLVWNRYRDPVGKAGRREQLSIAFSENDGVSWTVPQLLAVLPALPVKSKRESTSWIAYPYVFEPAPGRLWITTMQGRLRAALNERDFLGPVEKPLEGPALRIIALGDSLTRAARPGVYPNVGFSARLQAGLRAAGLRTQVHNVGIHGERTDQALRRLPRDVLSQQPHLVTVMYGTSDSWVERGRGEAAVSEAEYAANLREIVLRLRAGGVRVVLMTPPRFAEAAPRNGRGEDPNLRLERYVERCRQVARELNAPLVDHFAGWTAEQQNGPALQAWTTDGLHPNADGHADLVARMLAVVLPLAGALSP